MASNAKIDRWLSSAGVPKNNIVQVSQRVYKDMFSYVGASGNYLDWVRIDGLTHTITPYYPNSKILVMLDIHMGQTYWEILGRIARNGQWIGLGDQNGVRPRCTFADNNYEYYNTSPGELSEYSVYKGSVLLLDDPDYVDGSIEYTIWLNSYSGNTVYVNKPAYDNNTDDYWGAPISTLTLMEVSQ